MSIANDNPVFFSVGYPPCSVRALTSHRLTFADSVEATIRVAIPNCISGINGANKNRIDNKDCGCREQE
jgi:hypothetical protein